MRPAWPKSPLELFHILAAGLLMHAIQLGGSHSAQWTGVLVGLAGVALVSARKA